jgi:predicted nucleic acid-binding Zn ribbon protein
MGTAICGNCGAAIPEGMEFCTMCGEARPKRRGQMPAGARGTAIAIAVAAILIIAAAAMMMPTQGNVPSPAVPGIDYGDISAFADVEQRAIIAAAEKAKEKKHASMRDIGVKHIKVGPNGDITYSVRYSYPEGGGIGKLPLWYTEWTEVVVSPE